jgi:NAD(P)-dependent dehydrogenase (short-subunit alcohol dehydrogenase family)
MPNTLRLDNQVALITGGASGLGAATARRFAAAGARVALADLPRQEELAAQVQADCREQGAETLFIPTDVTDLASLEQMVRGVVQRFGRLDVLVNSAGTAIRKPALEFTERDWDVVLDINLKGTFFAAQAAARQMAQQGGGAIINLASIFGLVGGPNRASYCASKGGVVLLTKALAVEWAPLKIRVNAIAPTFVPTPLNAEYLADPAVRADLLSRTPMGTYAEPEDVAWAALYLASPAARYVTGITLPVDAGWLAQ